ncbi:MAG TPA: ATP-binding protein [Streptosporangiaceae bacterium]|nr:ATP-binding protein [Streptosporangiaceae bacterium]
MAGSARDTAWGSPAVPVPPRHSGSACSGEWPLRTFLELGALPTAVPCARYHVRQVLWEWHLAAQADRAELLVSELVTNAITASRATSPDSPVRLWLLSDSARILILVQDDSPHPPVRAELETSTERGRGLLLVEAISGEWDWYIPERSGAGKVTWAIIGPQDGQGV